MQTNENTTVSVSRKTMQRIRVIAARRGLRPGVLINRILSNRAAVKAALDALDGEADKPDAEQISGVVPMSKRL